MHEDLAKDAALPRGTQLLEEFLDVVPELAKLGHDEEPRAWGTINLFSQYWECLLDHVDDRDDKFRFDVVRGLRKLYNLHCETNVPVACGLLIVALNIEANLLYDEDARLVRSLTALQLAKARTAAAVAATGAIERDTDSEPVADASDASQSDDDSHPAFETARDSHQERAAAGHQSLLSRQSAPPIEGELAVFALGGLRSRFVT
jgi:hypothetical protein